MEGGSSFSFHRACSFALLQLNSFYRLIPDEKKTVSDNKHFCYQKKNVRDEDLYLKTESLTAVPSRPALQQTKYLHKAAKAPSLPRGTEDSSKLIKGNLTLTEDYIW